MIMMGNDNEYLKIRDLVYSATGIMVRDNRMESLSGKVDDRLRFLNMINTRDYRRYIYSDVSGREMEELVNAIVVGETYFFREYETLLLFAEKILPLFVEAKEACGQRSLNILSAGCSTGEEPYTLAIILREMLDNLETWTINIDGIDISRVSLQKAESGLYSGHALRETPYLYRDKYFQKIADSQYSIDQNLLEMVNFTRVNLFDENQVNKLFFYDFIFLRNVMIYFDQASAARVMESLHGRMRPGAYLFAGMAESVGRMTDIFTMERMGKSFVYHK